MKCFQSSNFLMFWCFDVFVFYSLAFSITLIFPIDKFCSIFLIWLFQFRIRSCLPDPCQLLFVLQTIIQTTIFCLISFLFVLFFRSKWLFFQSTCDQICQQKVIKRTLLSVWIQFRYLRKKFFFVQIKNTLLFVYFLIGQFRRNWQKLKNTSRWGFL